MKYSPRNKKRGVRQRNTGVGCSYFRFGVQRPEEHRLARTYNIPAKLTAIRGTSCIVYIRVSTLSQKRHTRETMNRMRLIWPPRDTLEWDRKRKKRGVAVITSKRTRERSNRLVDEWIGRNERIIYTVGDPINPLCSVSKSRVESSNRVVYPWSKNILKTTCDSRWLCISADCQLLSIFMYL